MQASLLIDPLLPSLKPTDSVDKALEWMSEYSLQHLAVADNDQYMGMVTEDGLHAYDISDLTIADVPLEYQDLFISEGQHIFEAIRLLNHYELSVIAILDHARIFTGVTTAQHIYHLFGGTWCNC
jgi:acetoin utilization protein AcuB